jgi:hypothetical protein
MDNFDAHKWFKKQYLEEGHTEDKMRDDMEARKRSKLSPDELKKLDAMVAFRTGKTTDLKENMSRGEAVVELNYYMDELQNISNEVSGIMQEYFPTEFSQGDAYGAFNFGSSKNPRDTTFEAILDDLASVGDDME